MKTIGILGGAGWAATIPAYEWINREVGRRLGGNHSARIILYSMDYDVVKTHYHHGWDKIPEIFKNELETVLALRPDCLFMACNTLHKAYDIIEPKISMTIPFFHAVRLTRDDLLQRGVKKALFLGTAFTMDDDYFRGPLKEAGIELVLPEAAERQQIQIMQARLAKGETGEDMTNSFATLLKRYEIQGCQNVVLACTELPLVINKSMTTMTIIDPLHLQCRAAVDFAFSEKDIQWTACA